MSLESSSSTTIFYYSWKHILSVFFRLILGFTIENTKLANGRDAMYNFIKFSLTRKLKIDHILLNISETAIMAMFMTEARAWAKIIK